MIKSQKLLEAERRCVIDAVNSYDRVVVKSGIDIIADIPRARFTKDGLAIKVAINGRRVDVTAVEYWRGRVFLMRHNIVDSERFGPSAYIQMRPLWLME